MRSVRFFQQAMEKRKGVTAEGSEKQPGCSGARAVGEDPPDCRSLMRGGELSDNEGFSLES